MHIRRPLAALLLLVVYTDITLAENPYAPSYRAEQTGYPHYLGVTNGYGRPSLFFPGYGYGYPAITRRPIHPQPLKCFDNPYGPPDAHEPVVYYRSPSYGIVFTSPCPTDPAYWWRAYRPTAAKGSGETSTPREEDSRLRPAQISMQLPMPDASVIVEGVATIQIGNARRFVTPALPPGTAHVYQVKASWRENGQTVSSTREVTVRAGEECAIDFTASASDTRTTQDAR